ncbi:conserved hypothetical protein [Crenothrix polyspora]|uniref:DUF2283 domain-containing protein n=1 Tax=Crenothrix polyspora TaxID=360316 RepID=A0A1R4H8R5_9GAMM|nr:DUF2283 domain-containing protein [Crenothrix polyspora]SJM92609.1 conserved hypothetical protein [Crenothrix polyspora]
MKIEFDPQADTAYIGFIEGDVARSKQLEPGIIADFDEQGQLLGLEILYVAKRSSVSAPKQAA